MSNHSDGANFKSRWRKLNAYLTCLTPAVFSLWDREYFPGRSDIPDMDVIASQNSVGQQRKICGYLCGQRSYLLPDEP